MKRFYGWKRQPHDDRDYRLVPSLRRLATLPQTIDLTPHMCGPTNQGNLGSCGPNSAAEMIQYDQAVQGLPVVPPSRLFIYYTTRGVMGVPLDQDTGVDNRSMMKALAQFGFCPETAWPYDTDLFATHPTCEAYDSAAPNMIRNYVAVANDSYHARACLANGDVFVWGGELFPQFESDEAAATGVIAMPQLGETEIGGHDMPVVGVTLVDMPGILPGNKWPAGTARLKNHWMKEDGTPWGDGGYCYLPLAYAFGKFASDFWTLLSVPAIARGDVFVPQRAAS